MSKLASLHQKNVESTQSEKAYRLMREDIISGALPPDLKLKINLLRQRYEIGAGPLREALARLSGDHLVVLTGQRGFVVSPMSAEDAKDVGRLRLNFEIEALASSIPLGDNAWEERVITTFHRLERSESGSKQDAEDLAQWEKLNRDFHEALVSACNSIWLLRLRDMMFHHHERYRRLSRVETIATRDVHVEHREMVDAALDRDVERAIKAMRTHIQRTTDAVSGAL